MKLNLTDTHDYLNEWHKSKPVSVQGSIDEILAAEQEKIDELFNEEKLHSLILNNGKENKDNVKIINSK
jgi:hypothetical protein